MRIPRATEHVTGDGRAQKPLYYKRLRTSILQTPLFALPGAEDTRNNFCSRMALVTIRYFERRNAPGPERLLLFGTLRAEMPSVWKNILVYVFGKNAFCAFWFVQSTFGKLNFHRGSAGALNKFSGKLSPPLRIPPLASRGGVPHCGAGVM